MRAVGHTFFGTKLVKLSHTMNHFDVRHVGKRDACQVYAHAFEPAAREKIEMNGGRPPRERERERERGRGRERRDAQGSVNRLLLVWS